MTDEIRRPWWAIGCPSLLTPAAMHGFQRFMHTYLVWIATWVGIRLLLESGVAGVVAWPLAGLSTLLGILTVATYIRFLRVADELLRKIQIEGIALGFGIGAVFMTSYRLFEKAGAPKLDVNDPVLIMVLFWAIGQWLGQKRYA